MVKIRVRNTEQNIRRMNRVKALLADMNKAGLWQKLSWFFGRIVKRMFSGESLYGLNQWPRISSTLYGRLRYSSKGNQMGRYSSSSLPMHVSGQYFASFKDFVTEAKTMKFGSTHPKAALLASAGWNRKSGRRPRRVLPDSNNSLFIQDINKIATSRIHTIIREVSQ